MGDFHDLEDSLAALNGGGSTLPISSKSRGTAGADGEPAAVKTKSLSALQKAVNSLAQKERTKKRRRETELAGDVDVPRRNPDEIRVRRPAPEAQEEGDFDEEAGFGGKKTKGKKSRGQYGDGDEEDDAYFGGGGAPVAVEDDPFYEAVAAKKAKKKAEKEALYAVEPTYGALEDELQGTGGEKRGINYEILKNRGLTAYKNKLNRNPRVKKREAYRKAVIRRKGQVRDVRASEAGNYGGEATGINARVVRVRGKKK